MKFCKKEVPAKSPISNTLNGFKLCFVSVLFTKTGFRVEPNGAIGNKWLFIFRKYSADKT